MGRDARGMRGWRIVDRPGAFSFEPFVHFAMLGTTVYAPTAAIQCQFREVSLRPGVRARHVEQIFFAWR